MKLPVDAPRNWVVKALQALGFHIGRECEHVAMHRSNADGTTTPLTVPNHANLKGSALQATWTKAHIPREEFLRADERS